MCFCAKWQMEKREPAANQKKRGRKNSNQKHETNEKRFEKRKFQQEKPADGKLFAY